MTEKKYEIIYADPPWTFNDKRKGGPKGNKGGGATHNYPTMDIVDIKTMILPPIADNAFLFLWVSNPLLQQGLNVIDEWGFKYITTGFTWVKQNASGKFKFGIGHYTRSNMELCLIAKRGKPKVVSHAVSSLVIEPTREHSRKPDCIRDKIVQLCGDLPRVELFARQQTRGWDVWGNEVDKFNKEIVND